MNQMENSIIPFTKIFRNFFEEIGEGEIEVYNEFSLQHELGIYLRKELLKCGKFKVQFEKNSLEILNYKESYSQEKFKNLIASIELKYPRNGQVPESMYSFVKDIRFLEGLTKKSDHNEKYFEKGFFICVVDDPLFYEVKNKKDGIYKYFRNKDYSVKIPEETHKPTGKNKGNNLNIVLDKVYIGNWEPSKPNNNKRKYLIIEVSHNTPT